MDRRVSLRRSLTREAPAGRAPTRRIRAVWSAAAALLLGLAAGTWAAPTIGPTRATPTDIVVNRSTLVTVTSEITDPTVIPTGVNLLETDASGRALRVLGTLRNDGAGGDQTAGDAIFTIQLSFLETQPTQRYLRVSAAFKGVLLRAQSPVMTLTFSTPRTVPTALTPNPLSLVVGAEGTLAATLAPAPTAPGALAISSQNGNVASAPASVSFVAGQTEVSIPILAVGEGDSTITAQLNGGSATALVRVVPSAPRIVALVPPSITLTAGASGQLAVRLSAAPSVETTIALTSDQPGVASVPATVTVAAGQIEAAVPVTGVTAGVAQVTARLGDSSASSQVTVTPAPPTVVSLLPPVSNLVLGAVSSLQLTISSTQATDTPVSIATTPGGIVTTPATVTVPAGQISASVPVTGAGLGQASVTATLNGSTASALVNVAAPSVEIMALEPESVRMTVGATTGFTVRINAAQTTNTEVALASNNPAVLETAASVTIESGQTSATLVATARAVGDAILTASVNNTSRQASIHVAPQAASLVNLVPSPLPLQEGATGLLTVSIDVAQEGDTVITLSNDAPAVVQAPANVTVPAGALSANIAVTALTAGRAMLTASLNAGSITARVDVTTPPPVVTTLTPSALVLPKGAPGTLRVSISRGPSEPVTVSVTSSASAVASAPADVVIPAGALFADFPVASIGVGEATITASLNGGSATAHVTVVAPEPTSLALTPALPTVAVGTTLAFRAIATLSDGGVMDVTSAAAWSSSATGVAAVDAGAATAIAAGETTIGASYSFTSAATGQSVTLTASTLLTVRDQPAIQLSTPVSTIAPGQTIRVTVSLTEPAPAGGLSVALGASGSGAVTMPASVAIAGSASSGEFDLTAVSAGEVVVTASGTGYLPGLLSLVIETVLRIDAVDPASAPVGASIALVGAGFDPSPAGNSVDFPTGQNGRIAAQVLAATTTRLTVRVPATAENGVIRVTNTRGTVTSPPFTVARERDFQLVVSPATVTVYQRAIGVAQVQLSATGSAPLTALVNLSVAGLPAGVTARFLPAASITADQTVVLELSAAASAAVGTSSVTVRGELPESGQPLVRTTQVDVAVQSSQGVTGVKGRFVTPEKVGIGGVIVRVDTASGPIQTTTDAAGNFALTGLPAGSVSLRFDATPANPLYPIWPYTTVLLANQVTVLPDWTINPPPSAEKFTPLANATQDQIITDPRYPGLQIRLPRGATIVGWDGVPKNRVAVERIDIAKLPVPAPPTPTGAAYQLYFGTPMGGVPSVPIPVTLPNDVGGEPGEGVDVWFFDGSPMTQTGVWRVAGSAIVSPDGKSATMPTGSGIPRFCGVCGLVCLGKQPPAPNPPPPPPPPPPTQPDPPEPPTCAGNPVELFTGQELPTLGGLTCRGLTPVQTGLSYNPVDAFDNIGGTAASMGFGWVLDYDISFLPFVGPQKRLILPGNRRTNFVDDGTGTYRSFDDPRFDGAVIRATNLAGNEWELTFRDNSKWRFRPFTTVFVRGGPPTFLTETIDPQGNVLHIQRRQDGRITSIGTAARGVTMTYGANGFVSEIRDTASRTMRYAYNSDNRLQTVTDADGRATQYTYVGDEEFAVPQVCGLLPSTGERLKTIQYPGRPNPTVNHYGPGRRVLRQIAYDGLEHRFSYRVTGACVVNVSTPNTVCQGAQCPSLDSWENFQAGWRMFGGAVVATTVTNPDGKTYTSEFNPRGVTTAHTDADGQQSTFVVDSANRITERVDALGRRWRYEYDARGNFTQTMDPLNRATQYAYDPKWNTVTSVTRFDDNNQPLTWRFTYDVDTGMLLTSTNPLDQVTRFSYTSRGEPATITSPLDQVTRFEYTTVGDLQTVIDPLANETRYEHDGAGRQVLAIDSLGAATQWQRNGSDQVTQMADALGQVTRIHYDLAGRLVSVVNARGHAIESYEHDAGDRLVARIDALGRRTSYDYDASGRLQEVTNRAGHTTSYSYDDRSRITSISRPEGLTRFSYDTVGRLIELTEPAGTLSYTYDALDRLVREIQSTEASQVEVSYTYDGIGRRVSRTVNGVPTETTVYGYDRANRLTSIVYRGETTAFSYDAGGRLRTTTLPNGIVQTLTYDDANRLTNLVYRNPDGSIVESLAYSYDANGRRTSRTTAAGTLNDTPFTATYDAADRMTAITLTDAAQTFALTYDEDGNLASRVDTAQPTNVTTYSWDSRHRLVGIEGPGVQASFRYDALNRRTTKIVNGQQVDYAYDGRQAIVEMSGAEAIPLLTAPGLDEVIARYAAGGARYYLTDALNSVIAQTRADRSIQNRYAYSAFGEVASLGDDQGNSVQYTARENDRTGLHYYRARYYDPVLKRFIQSDPVGLAAGMNTYSYVGGDPLTFNDPEGLGACNVTFPDYPIEYSTGRTSTWLGGHGGVVGYDESGQTRYYEYGRYSPSDPRVVGEKLPAEDGNVRRIKVPDLKLDKDGKPTPESLKKLKDALSKRAGKNTRVQLTCDAGADEDKVYDYAMDIANDANRSKYSWTPWNPNHCRSFASGAYNAGR